MSKLVACSVFDLGAQFFHPPVFFRAAGAATRWFEDTVKNPESGSIHDHPEHFQLFHVGEFDDFSGVFVPISPSLMLHASAFDSPAKQG